MFTDEEKQLIAEQLGEEWRRKLEQLEEEAIRGKQLEVELIENLQKIYSNPSAKEKFKKALETAGIQIPVPDTPFDQLYSELKATKKEISKIKNYQEEREKILKALEEYGISEDEYEDLIKFQKEYKIQDNLKAIELYALAKRMKMRETEELMPLKKISIGPVKEYTEEEAYRRTIEELRKAKLI